VTTDVIRIRGLLLLAGCSLICKAAGVLGAFATVPAIPGGYVNLDKTFFTPPNWVFEPVWMLLYGVIGISLLIILRFGGNDYRVRNAET
jgi:translocator protein